jgi:hypothetical protein
MNAKLLKRKQTTASAILSKREGSKRGGPKKRGGPDRFQCAALTQTEAGATVPMLLLRVTRSWVAQVPVQAGVAYE